MSALTSIATLLTLSGTAYLAPLTAVAAVPSDYGLTEGNTISATGSSDPDVYIVNEQGYKRLFLNPAIFNLYGHLGGFASVKSVSAAARDAFPTSGLFRVDGTEKVYGLETTGEDVASLRGLIPQARKLLPMTRISSKRFSSSTKLNSICIQLVLPILQ